MSSIRAFIAIELSETLRAALQEAQKDLSKSTCDVVWVRPENMHLTLKFLGEVPTQDIECILHSLSPLLDKIPPFEIQLDGLGVFPDARHPRVIWAGIKDEQNQLTRVVNMIEEALILFGFTRETRTFTPHLTIGRIKADSETHPLMPLIEKYHFKEKIVQRIEEISLFKSTLTNDGPIYEKLS